METKRDFLVSTYSAPDVDIKELEMEQGFAGSTFGIESEEIGELEELV